MQIVCTDLSIGYNNTPLHSNINFTIPKGAYVCIVGENGSGKSTLIKTILGLLPAINGTVKVADNFVGYLPQQTQVQKDFPASVFEVVLSGCLNKVGMRPFYNKAEKNLARQMLDKLNILDLQRKSYSELSGGQQQRVLLARALCATDKILLLDEPTASLDAASTQEFYNIIKSLNDEGITIIMITHNLNDAINDANFIIRLDDNGVNCMTVDAYKSGVQQ